MWQTNEYYQDIIDASEMMRGIRRNTNKIVKKILEYYVELEKEIDGPFRYYCNVEFDSTVNIFEALSNAGKIGIVTKLDERDAEIIVNILHGILMDNLWWFEIGEVAPGWGGLTKQEADEMKSYDPKYFMTWIEFFRQNANTSTNTYDELPENDDPPEDLTEFEQQMLTLNQINTNLRITKTGIVEIINY